MSSPYTLSDSPSTTIQHTSSQDATPIIDQQQQSTSAPGRGARFWLVFLALCIALFVSALDALIVATALPTIIYDLQGSDFVWVANAYTLASTSIMPWTGSLATIFGRKPVMLSSLVLFFLGSGLAGGANSMAMLIAARTVQGLGGGGILTMTEVIVGDLVPVAERGPFFGIIGAVWAVASAVAPPLGGVFAEDVSWRWIFYINLPITAVAIVLVVLFFNLKVPQESLKEKFAKMDWIGNLLIVGGTTSAIIGLSWAGVTYPWGSVQTLTPLILGLVTLGVAFVYEAKVPIEPTVPFEILSNKTTVSGYITTGLHAIVMSAVMYYIPVYFQSAKLASPIKSSVYTLGSALSIAPAAIATGASVAILRRYFPQNVIAWVLLAAGMGAFITLDVDSNAGRYVGFQVLAGVGAGMLFPATNFVVIAPLPLSLNAQALAFFTFVRQFFMTWGTTIGATVLQNELKKKLPADFVNSISDGHVDLTYATIPRLPFLEPTLLRQVQDAFADSLRIIWIVLVAISGLGLIVSLVGIKEVEMASVTDEKWGLEEKKRKGDVEDGLKEVESVTHVAQRVRVGDEEKVKK